MIENNVSQKIVDLLKKHPEGLTTVEIARYLGTHRHTITKYVYQLLGSGVIKQRKIGPAKLCILKKVEKR